MKHKSRIILPILTFLTFGMVVGSVIANDFVKEDVATEEAEAATSNYPNKMYLNIYDDGPGAYLSGSKSVQIHAWSGSNYTDITGISHNGIGVSKGYTFLFDSTYIGWNYKVVIRKDGGDGWSTDGSVKQLPAADSTTRWITWYSDWGIDVTSMADLNTATSYDNSTVTCNLSGEYAGKSGEVVSRDFTVTVGGTIPSGKVALLGQYSNSACTTQYLTNVFTLTNSKKVFSGGTFTFNSAVYFKPILYDKHYISYDGGTNWTEMTNITINESDATMVQFSNAFTNKPAGTLIRYKYGSTQISSIKFDASSNIIATSTPGTFKLVHTASNTAYLKVTKAGVYTTYVGGIPTQSAGHYFLNVTTGDIYHCTYDGVGQQVMDDKVWINEGDKIEMFNSNGTANTFYATNSINSQTKDTDKTFRFHTDADGTVECLISDYYKLYKQKVAGEDYNIFYAGIEGCDISYVMNGHGSSIATHRACKGELIDSEHQYAPEATGWVFNGWFTDEELEEGPWDYSEDTPSGDTTFYASWTARTYTLSATINHATVRFYSDSGHETQVTTAEFGSNVWYNILGDEGYRNGSGTKLTVNESTFTLNDSLNTATKDLTSQSPGYATLKINFNANGGSGSTMSFQSYLYNTDPGDKVLPACEYTKANYTFKEWNTQANGKGTSLPAGTKLSVEQINAYFHDGYETGKEVVTKTVYAIWELNVSYDVVINDCIGYSFTLSKEYLVASGIQSIKVVRPDPKTLEYETITDEAKNIPSTSPKTVYIKVNMAQLNDPVNIYFYTSTNCTGEPYDTISNTVGSVLSGCYSTVKDAKKQDAIYGMLAYGHFARAAFGRTMYASPIEYVPTEYDQRSTLLGYADNPVEDTTASSIAKRASCDFSNFSIKGGNDSSGNATLVFRYLFDSSDFNSHQYAIGSLGGLSGATATLGYCYGSDGKLHHYIEIAGIKAREIGTSFTVTVTDVIDDKTVTAFQLTHSYINYLKIIDDATTGKSDVNSILQNKLARATYYYYTRVNLVS